MYNEKYYHEYCNRYGTVCRVSVLERDYEGEPMDKDCASVPITIGYESITDDKFDRLKASTAEVRFIGDSEFNMEELYTADSKQYRVDHIVGGQLKWTGWVVPNGFAEDWSGGLREMVIQATDGLSLLNQYRFLSPSGDIWVGYMRHTTILRQCLDFIGLELPLHTMVNLEYEGQVQDEDPVYAAMTNPRTYMDTTVEDEDTFNHVYTEYKNNVMSCYEVVMDICRVWGAKLYQKDGAWKFKRIAEDYGNLAGKFWRVYENNSGQSGTIPYDPIVTFPCMPDDRGMVLDGAVMRMDNVYKWQNYQYVYRYKKRGDSLPPFINNGRFDPVNETVTDPVTYTPQFWIRQGTGILAITKENPLGGDVPPGILSPAIGVEALTPLAAGTTLQSTTSMSPLFRSGDTPVLRFWMKTPTYEIAGGNFLARTAALIKIRFLSSSANGINYFLVNSEIKHQDTYGSRWVEINKDTPEYHFVCIPNSNPNDPSTNGGWGEVIIDVADIPGDKVEGRIVVELVSSAVNQAESGRPGLYPTFVLYDTINYIFSDGRTTWQDDKLMGLSNRFLISDIVSGNIIDDSRKTVSKGRVYNFDQNKVYNKVSEPVNILTSDVKNENLIGGIYFNSEFNPEYREKWNDIFNPYPTYAPLGMIASRDIMRQYRNIWRVIESDLIANDLDIDTCIVFEDRPNERYVVQRGYFNEKECLLTGSTLFQISDSSDSQIVGTETTKENLSDVDLERRFIN